MSDDPTPTPDPKPDEGKTYTQADVNAEVDKIAARIRAEERKKAAEKFADYDALKAKAGEAQTVEEQLAELREQLVSTKIEAARASVAARFGISTERGKDGEPSDAELFLTGTDEETLTAQAKRLAARESAQKKQGNHVPREGNNPNPQATGDPLRDFTRNLFARATSE